MEEYIRTHNQFSPAMPHSFVSNDSNANNAIKKYFNSLGNFMGVEPSTMNINKTQSVQPDNNVNLEEEVDTEEEDETPELVMA